MRWTTTKESNQYMAMRKVENLAIAARNPNEIWMKEKLKTTGYKWGQQSRWGYRIFDFWNHKLGIAIEVDGPSHNPVYDSIRDKHNYERSRILVLRVRNMNEADAANVLEKIRTACSWNDRRKKAGLKPVRGADL
jgi:very-short-patch-repair endonuclease